MHTSTTVLLLALTASVCWGQVTISEKRPNDKSTTSRQAVVIRASKITVNRPKLPPVVSGKKLPNPLKVLIIGTVEDAAAIELLRKTADVLADAGYGVTLLSTKTVSLTSPPPGRYNLKEIDYGVKGEALVNAWHQYSVLERIRAVRRLTKEMLTFCKKVFDRMDVIDWIRNEKFDIAITCGATCFQPLLRMAGIQKSIILTTSEPTPWIVKTMGIPDTGNPTVKSLSYFRRAKTVLSSHIEERLLQYGLTASLNGMGERMVGERFTPFQDAVAQTSFLLVNSDELVDFPRALTSQWVYIGGLGVKHPSKLGQQWSALLSTRARNVLVSFDSDLPGCEQKSSILLRAFLEIPDTTFIWRNASGAAQNQSNVVFLQHFAEGDLLADPRVTAVITDGRTHTLFDILAGGKPVICLPSNFEQQGNCDRLHEQGIAIVKECNSLRSYDVKEMIKQCTATEIRGSSATARETLKSKLASRNEKLVRTVEYAAKYSVIPRSRSSVLNEGLLEFYHLDIFIPVLLLLIAFMALIAWLICITVDNFCKKRSQANDEVNGVKTSDPVEHNREEKYKPDPLIPDVSMGESQEITN